MQQYLASDYPNENIVLFICNWNQPVSYALIQQYLLWSMSDAIPLVLE